MQNKTQTLSQRMKKKVKRLFHRITRQDDTPNLQLLQVSHGIVHAAVDSEGGVEDVDADAGSSTLRDDMLLKPSTLAIGESEAEDSNSMHLLQTSRDVMPATSKGEDTLVNKVNASPAIEASVPSVSVQAEDEAGVAKIICCDSCTVWMYIVCQ